MSKWDSLDWCMFFVFAGFGVMLASIGIAFVLDVGFKVGGCG